MICSVQELKLKSSFEKKTQNITIIFALDKN